MVQERAMRPNPQARSNPKGIPSRAPIDQTYAKGILQQAS